MLVLARSGRRWGHGKLSRTAAANSATPLPPATASVHLAKDVGHLAHREAATKVTGAIIEAFLLLQWYARNHTLACVVPALFIAGAIYIDIRDPMGPVYLGLGIVSILASITVVYWRAKFPGDQRKTKSDSTESD